METSGGRRKDRARQRKEISMETIEFDDQQNITIMHNLKSTSKQLAK